VKIGRTLPPVGYPVPVLDVLGAVAGLTKDARQQFELGARSSFGAATACAVSSGKAALTVILQSLHALTGRRKVILPAYTCYSVPSAVVKAGLVPVPCDIGRDSFDYDYDQLGALLESDVLCALSVHLFGISSDTGRLERLCRPNGIFVVEDAAQAMGVEKDGALLGTRADAGFFSLGRGKNLTAGSGGLIVTSRPDVASALEGIESRLPAPGPVQDALALAGLLALSALISPRVYWLPAGIPWLKLGETIFDEDFPITKLSNLQAGVLRDWAARLDALNEVRHRAGQWYHRELTGVTTYGRDVPYLRFPVLVDDLNHRDRILHDGRVLGISRMYPTSVSGIRQIRHHLGGRTFPEADRVAARLITLPTHPFVRDGDRARIVALVNDHPRIR